MRNPNICRLAALAALALALAACGSSNKEISAAKTARYKGDKTAMFTAMQQATQATYKLQKADPSGLAVQTVPRWYTPDGLEASERGDIRDVPDNSVNLSLVATLLPDGDAWIVHIKPIMMRYHAGSPEPEPLSEDDISVPGWAHEKVDALASDIHKALASYEVKQLPEAVPAGPAAPAAGSAAAPAAPAAPAAGAPAPATPAPATPAPAPAPATP